MNSKSKNRLIILLQIAAFCVFLGRGWQHIVWDAPYRTLLWDEQLMKWIVENLFATPWQDYITSPQTDNAIQGFIKWIGWFYISCAFMVLLIRKWQKVAGVFMIIGSISLIILALLYCKERFFSLGQFLEYALQFLSPLFLYYFIKQEVISNRFILVLKIATALTFVCHGLYAIGYYPRPREFTEMTMIILRMEENTAVQFLLLAGIMDFIIGVGVFLPLRFSKWIIIYAVGWGFFTTIARVWANVEMDYFLSSANQFVFESIYRVPHFILPIVLLLLLTNMNIGFWKKGSKSN